MSDVIELENVYFSYDNNDFIKSLSFSIPEARVFGFLGPNGSGKTTTVRLINGILSYKNGSIKVFGREIKENITYVHQNSGVLTETASLYKNLTGRQNIEFFAKLYGLSDQIIKDRLNWLEKRLEISFFWNKKVKEMSTGMRKRIALSVALIHMPSLIFLDEPTTGLDPETTLMVKELLKELVNQNKSTIFLCTHLLKEAEEICDIFGLLREGRLLAFGSLKELLANFEESIYLKIRGRKPVNSKIKYREVEEGVFHIYFENGSDDMDSKSFEIIKKWISEGGRVYEAKVEHWNLEKIYFSY